MKTCRKINWRIDPERDNDHELHGGSEYSQSSFEEDVDNKNGQRRLAKNLPSLFRRRTEITSTS